MEPTDKKPKKRRRTGKKYTVEVEVTYIPVPPEKEAAYEYSMRMLGKMLLDLADRARRAQREQQSHAEVPKPEDEEKAASSTNDLEKGEAE